MTDHRGESGYVALPNLLDWRKHAYLSRQDLAARAGISKYTIMTIEHGRYRASYRSVRALAEALGISPAQLVEQKPGD